MVLYVGAVFLLLAYSGVSTGQRKLSRNVPVGADVKTGGARFDCPEEFGYYPHPTDCTQYYVCVFGGALLESCTGGLMYSHELQTCDWPRNVGCDPSGDVRSTSNSNVSPSPSGRAQPETSRVRYTNPPPPPHPPQPSAVVTSRGQSRQLHHNQHEIIKQQQQQQLYAEAEETLPPAEEVESDRQQRVYRGQPSTVGQVQRDRDGLRHSNAIPSSSGRGEKIGVISFGTQPLQQYRNILTNDLTLEGSKRHKRQVNQRVEVSTASPVHQQSLSTATARNLYNGSQQYEPAQYDPYYSIYDDDVELYRDVDYSQHYSNTGRTASQQPYRGTSAPITQVTPAPEEPPKRGSVAYIPNTYTSTQDIYQQPIQDYSEDNYSQVDDQASYRQPTKQSSRGDRNELNYVEETSTTTKRTTTATTTRTTTTTTTTPRPIPTQKVTVPSRSSVTANVNQTRPQSIHNTLPKSPGHTSLIEPSNNPRDHRLDVTAPFAAKSGIPDPVALLSVRETVPTAVISQPAPFALPKHLITTQKPMSYHFITKSSSSATKVSELHTTEPSKAILPSTVYSTITPTTYAPSKFFLKSFLPKTVAFSTTSEGSFLNFTEATSESNLLKTVQLPLNGTKAYKAIKTIRKLINPVTINNEFSSSTTEYIYRNSSPKPKIISSNENISFQSTTVRTTTTTPTRTTVSTTTITPRTTSTRIPTTDADVRYKLRTSKLPEKLRKYQHYDEPSPTDEKRFRATVEIPSIPVLLSHSQDLPKVEVDLPPTYKPKATLPTPTYDNATKTMIDTTRNTSFPARVSRVNAAIKSVIAFGGSRRQNAKCNESQSSNVKCNEIKQRTSSRGRGSAHYSSTGGGGESVSVNRGTPPPRSRPTLKPSTSIVSKAAEFVDIYKYPPLRNEPIYPQPQPDKTAAKCRKDVCLLPDCSCGGKEIPGELPVEQVPQIVLLTYDDSVNDLNKGLYSDLFEKGRVNPNGCPIAATFYVSHEWTDYSQVQNLYSDGHEIASHTVSHSFGEQFSQKKWTKEVAGQREILAAYGGVHLEDVRGMRAPFLSVGGNKMFKMLYDSNFTYDSSMPIYENKPPSWPYTLDYKLFHDCMIPPCPTRSYPGVWEVPMVMWQDLNGGRCSMGDACSNPPDADGVVKMLMKNFDRHYTTNRAPFGLFYHAAWFTQPHHKEGFIRFLDAINSMKDVWIVTNWQALQWVRDPTPTSRIGSFQPFQCNYNDRPKKCNNPKVCNLWHKSGVRYMRTCQPCPDIYPWTGNTGIRSSRIDNDIEDK